MSASGAGRVVVGVAASAALAYGVYRLAKLVSLFTLVFLALPCLSPLSSHARVGPGWSLTWYATHRYHILGRWEWMIVGKVTALHGEKRLCTVLHTRRIPPSHPLILWARDSRVPTKPVAGVRHRDQNETSLASPRKTHK